MDDDFLAKVGRTYSEHPLTAASILGRIRRRTGSLRGVTEMDLAVDEETYLTDQNHVGGVGAVTAIAQAVGLRGGERVLDVGTGLGGTPRLLAHLYGCRCHGVELTATRHRDAIVLTRLVGLEGLVTFSCGDFQEEDVPGGPFDLVIGQGSFMHFPDHGRLLRKCADLLKPGGWVAIEDGYLRREPAEAEEARKLEALFDCWNGRFHPLAHWGRWLDQAGLAQPRFEALSPLDARELRERVRSAEREGPGRAMESELLGLRLGAELYDAGLIDLVRILARRPRSSRAASAPAPMTSEGRAEQPD